MIVRCSECGQKNRIPARRIAERPRCGKCNEPIDTFSHPVNLTGEELDEVIAFSDRPVFVDFWAPWCGPCKMVAPEIEKLAQRHADEIIVAKVNTQDYPQVSQKYGIRGIPRFTLFEGGSEAHTETGAMKVEQLESRFQL
ncbi:MAG: thioredoxin [Myxococcota bacterium]